MNKSRTGERPWVRIYLDGHDKLAKAGFPQRTYQVLHKLLAHVQWNNICAITQKEIARELGMRQPAVSRSIKQLVEAGIIYFGKKQGISRVYFFDPRVGYMGERFVGKVQAIKRSQHLEWEARINKDTGEIK